MTLTTTQEASFVEAELNYLDHDGTRPVTYAFPAPAGKPQSSVKPLPRRVRIEDGRLASPSPSLDTHGFTLLRAPTSVVDFRDEAAIRGAYYAEAEAILKRATGAAKVVIFDHTLRWDEADHQESGTREPVRRVHNDQTFVSGPRRVRDHLPAAEAAQRLTRRHAIVNLWRPIGAPVETAPLALCDARSIPASDLLPSDLVYPDKVGETYAFLPNPRHRWFYFSRVREDEVILLKIFDSLEDGTARLTAHTAFDHPRTRENAPRRRSIELRTLLFWE
ncbi:MAG TPA: CmcJ/NvfI family oxidoreductase [Polyangiales bacterium]